MDGVIMQVKYSQYKGYKEDWYKIQLGNNWNQDIPCKIVQCLDEDIYLNEYFDTIGVFDNIE